MKIEIRQSFVMPPSAPFQIGEILDVNSGIAKMWIDAGRAVAIEEAASPVAAPVTRREKALRHKLIETR